MACDASTLFGLWGDVSGAVTRDSVFRDVNPSPLSPPLSPRQTLFSIAAGCAGLLAEIVTRNMRVRISSFARTARDARSDLDAVSRELTSLYTVLELIRVDSETSQSELPETIVHYLCEILSNCNGVVGDIEVVLRTYEGGGSVSGGRWAMSGRVMSRS
jgi:hypothetical protein